MIELYYMSSNIFDRRMVIGDAFVLIDLHVQMLTGILDVELSNSAILQLL